MPAQAHRQPRKPRSAGVSACPAQKIGTPLITRLPALLAALLITCPAASPHAQTPNPRDADPRNLEELESRIGTSLERRKQLAAETQALSAEVAKLRDRQIETAARVQAREQEVSESEGRLDGLIAAEAVVAARLEKRHDELSETLSALQRLNRHPPPALAVRPDDALAALHGALLLGAVAPELKAEADELRARLDELAILRAEIEQERKTLILASTALSEEQAALEQLIIRKLASQTELVAQANHEQATLDRLSREARTLKDLIAGLEAHAAGRLPPVRPEPAPATLFALPVPRPSPNQSSPDQSGPALAANTPSSASKNPQTASLQPPPASSFGRRFSEVRGLLSLPAEGRTIKSFGSIDELGGKTNGITVETRPGAQITAPFDGRIVFAGPFRRYGQLLIISVGEGYHVLLAGMARISGIVGQNILAGEPIGTMSSAFSGNTGSSNIGADQDTQSQNTPNRDRQNQTVQKRPKPALYIEFRKDGEPIDPQPWLVASDRKARG